VSVVPRHGFQAEARTGAATERQWNCAPLTGK